MRGRDNSYPGVQLAALKVAEDRFHHRLFPANCLKLIATPTLPVEQM